MCTPVKVLCQTRSGWWRVIVGPGVELLDGGLEQDWPEVHVPAQARRPNAEFYLLRWEKGVPVTTLEPPAKTTNA